MFAFFDSLFLRDTSGADTAISGCDRLADAVFEASSPGATASVSGGFPTSRGAETVGGGDCLNRPAIHGQPNTMPHMRTIPTSPTMKPVLILARTDLRCFLKVGRYIRYSANNSKLRPISNRRIAGYLSIPAISSPTAAATMTPPAISDALTAN